MGTGGGGEIEWARPLIDEVYKGAKPFRLVEPNELRESDIVVIVSKIGGGVTPEQAEKVKKLKRTVEKPEQLAFSLLGKRLGRKPSAVIPTELGAGNTLAAMCSAAMLNLPTVDADCMGRAKPELQISTTNVSGVPITPVCLVTHYGDELYLDNVSSDARAEDILRAVTAASGGMAGLCRCPMSGEVVRRATVGKSISLCIEVGKTLREAAGRGEGPVGQVVKVLGGKILFEGKVSDFERKEKDAFVWGNIILGGVDGHSGHEFRIMFKNEYLMSWLDGKPFVTCPDTICVVDAASGQGLSNWGSDFAKGREVVVFGIEANKFFGSEKGLEIFSPRSFGHDVTHIPMKDLVQ